MKGRNIEFERKIQFCRPVTVALTTKHRATNNKRAK